MQSDDQENKDKGRTNDALYRELRQLEHKEMFSGGNLSEAEQQRMGEITAELTRRMYMQVV